MKTKRIITLILLLTIFILPGIGALVLYKHPEWWEVVRTNKGALVNPPVAFVPVGPEDKWHMMYWYPGACDAQCEKQIDRLARLRLALGRHLYQVDLWVLVPDSTYSLDSVMMAKLKDADINLYRVKDKDLKRYPALTAKSEVYLANPDHYMVLTYQVPVKLNHMYHDLKQLIK